MIDQATIDMLIQATKEGFEEKVPFNKVLGVRVESLSIDNVCVMIEMKSDLVGNFMKSILHGGVICCVLDITGGLCVLMRLLKEVEGDSLETLVNRYVKLGTIDMRVDFLRPGLGKFFRATGSVLNIGKSIAVVRTTLHNDQNQLIAASTGTYRVG